MKSHKFLYKVIFWIFILKMITASQLMAQQNIDQIIENILENYIETASEEYDFTELSERLYYLYSNPINLNSCTYEDLSKLIFLNEGHKEAILKYQKRYLGFASIYELKMIPELDPETLGYLLNFITIGESQKFIFKPKDLITRASNEILMKYEQTLEKQQGYLPPDTISNPDKQYYTGSPYKLYARYNRKVYNQASIGITMEKDAGEQFFKGHQKQGFDFYSAHFYLRDYKNYKAIAIGDFQANFGQGLIFHPGFSIGKSTSVLDFRKIPNDISPYKSVNENNFLRGIGISYQINKLLVSGFYSYKKIDGNVFETDSATYNEENSVSSFYNTGYHRTPNEFENKKSISEQLIGLRLSRGFNNAKIGLSSIYGKFSHSISPSDALYKIYDFSGNSFLNLSFDYSFSFKNLFIFGETGSDLSNFATLNGAFINLGSKMKAGILIRNYPKTYQALYSNAFRENTHTQNENGYYFALNYLPSSKLSLNAYIDIFSFPWLKYLVDLPSHGHEIFTEINYFQSYRTKMYARFKYYQKEKNSSENSGEMPYIQDYSKLSIRYQINHKIDYRFEIKSRVEYSRYNTTEVSQGVLTYIDFKYKFPYNKFSISSRYGIFNIDDYDSRIYAYENDILYSFSIPAFYGKGMRYYMVLNFNPSKKLSFWLKAGQANYFDRQTLGSGLTEINGNKKSELKLMMRYRF